MPDERTRSNDISAAEADLQASSALFIDALERTVELERTKREMPEGDERREQLAQEIEEITLDMVARGRYQTRLIQLEEQASEGGEPARATHVVLEEWRSAERRLHEARAELERATDAADRLREEHRRAFTRLGQ